MGKGRKPCCDKAGVKKGPWSPAKDFKLMSFIQKHGHNNWRALPKLAGLARCGKSCRLRWVNYLRPDLKRGNFTPQEEEAIIKLHEILGNKWSKIASHFPGRTDNEIKNVWNTHLKKRIKIKGSNNNVLSTNAPTSNNESLPTTTPQYVNEVFDECNENLHCSNEEIRGTTNNDTMEYSSSSSTSYNSITMIENVGEPKDETISKCTEKNKHVLQDEPIEIPYEPNLDLWDLLHAESEIHQFKDVNIPIISEIDIKNGNIDQDSESWWWLVYLENELGLDHQNESTPLQSSNNVTSTHDLSSDIFSSSKFT